MTLKQDKPKEQAWKATLMEALKEEDFLRPLVQEIVEQVLEAEMDETLGKKRASARPIRTVTEVAITRGRW